MLFFRSDLFMLTNGQKQVLSVHYIKHVMWQCDIINTASLLPCQFSIVSVLLEFLCLFFLLVIKNFLAGTVFSCLNII